MKEATTMLINGNHAVSYGAMLSNPRVIPIYPITPQTPIAEKLTELQAAGEVDAEFITPESEHSAMAACISASLSGARVFTATASQGLMLMHELLHYASGARAPIVMANVNRTIGSPWGFWPDQTDSLAQRDTGWIQYYTESPQESLDTIIQAYKTAEKVCLPAMVIHEAFYVSHTLEPVEVPSKYLVSEYLPPFNPEKMLDPSIKSSWGNVVDRDMFFRHRKQLGEAMEKTFSAAIEADEEWKELTGRGYGILEKYRTDGAEILLITMGSISGTARVSIDIMREMGMPIGLLKVKLFRPFPDDAIRKELKGVSKAVVLDRNFAPGLGGILHQEIKASLLGMETPPKVYGYLTGVGGLNVSPEKIQEVVEKSSNEEPSFNTEWVE